MARTSVGRRAARLLESGSSPSPRSGAESSADGVRLGVPGAANNSVSLAAAGSEVVVAWAARSGAATDVYAAWSRDGGASFGEPARVNDVAGDARVSGEQAPRVALGASTEVVWVSRQDGASVVRAAKARTGERRFEPATTVHAAGLTGARGWASLAVDKNAAVHVAWLDGRNAQAAAGGRAGNRACGSQGNATGSLPGRLVAGRDPLRDPRRHGRLLLLQDRRRDGSGRNGLRRLAPHLPAQPARHGGRALHRRRPDVRRAGAGQRRRLGARRLPRRRPVDRGGLARRPAHRLADAGSRKREREGHLLQLLRRRRAHVRGTRPVGRRGRRGAPAARRGRRPRRRRLGPERRPAPHSLPDDLR